MINVIVARKKTVTVTANQVGGIIEPSSAVTLQKVPTINTGKTRLDSLDDVSSLEETSGATLVYDSVTDKYIVQKLNLSDTVGTLDGGEF